MESQITYYQNKLKYEMDSWDLFESLNRGEKIVVIDARSAEAYGQEHIPDSVNLPHENISSESTKFLTKDRLYVSYCDGIGCNGSTKGALALAKLGFKVKELIGGLDWWKRDGYKTIGKQGQDAKEIMCGC